MTRIRAMGTESLPGDRSAPSTLIVLVRHGVTPTTGQVLPGRAPGLHLSGAGTKQARAVARRLDTLPPAAIYTSPLERTRETASPAAGRFGLTPVVCEGVVECDFGEWTGGRLSELSRLPEWETVQKSPSQFRFPGGESFAQMQQRMVAALRGIAARHPGEVVACFSHADPIKAAVAHLSGRTLDEFQSVRIDPASVSVAEFSPDGATAMRAVNSTAGPLPGRPEAGRP